MAEKQNNFQQKLQGLTQRIVIGMLIGVILGLLIRHLPIQAHIKTFLSHNVFKLIGEIFLKLLEMLVVPVVLISLVRGTGALSDASQLGRIGIKTVVLYLLTTVLAITLALLFALIFNVGTGVELTGTAQFQIDQPPSVRDVILSLFPKNPVRALAEGNMLQVIVFSLFLGGACIIAGKAGDRVLKLFDDFYNIVMYLIVIIMRIAPLGVLCLLTSVFIEQGYTLIMKLLLYFIVVLLVLGVHFLISYSAFLTLLGRLNPKHFFRKMYQVMIFAFSVSSSNASIPVVWENARYRLGVDNFVASFVIPLGATINMDGTSIMQGVATVFIANAYQIDIGLAGYLTVILMAVLASIGTAGVPSVGLITLAMVLNQVGLPVEGIALIIGVDRLLDMARTAVNIAGDSMISCVVAKTENALDTRVYTS